MSEIFSKILKDKNGKVLNVGSKYTQPEWGSEVAEVEILPQTSFNSDSEVSLGGLFVFKYPTSRRLEAEKEYIVEFNGKEYILTAWEHHQTIPMNPPVEMTFTVLGNGMVANVEGVETNIPFGIVQGENHEIKDGQLKIFDGSTYATISIKAVEETIHKLPSKYVEGVGKYKQPEWGAEEVVLLPETELAFAMNDDLGMDCAFVELSQALAADTSYAISFNGTVYNCKSIAADDGSIVVGNATAIDGAGNDEPFMLLDMGGMNIVIPLDGSASATMSVVKEIAHEIPTMYLETKEPLIVNCNVQALVNGFTYEMVVEAIKQGRTVFLQSITNTALSACVGLSVRDQPVFINAYEDSISVHFINEDGAIVTRTYSPSDN